MVIQLSKPLLGWSFAAVIQAGKQKQKKEAHPVNNDAGDFPRVGFPHSHYQQQQYAHQSGHGTHQMRVAIESLAVWALEIIHARSCLAKKSLLSLRHLRISGLGGLTPKT